jgi:N6-adenosine-specific RNA methylase IME4
MSLFAELNPPYATIVADPPWPYDTSLKGTSALPHTVKRDGSVARGVDDMGYGVMTIADLCAMPVPTIAAKNAHLYLWVTNSFMVEGHEICGAWGFKPKTILTWVKTRQDDADRVSMKTGYYFRGATEHCIFAVRGSLPLTTTVGVPTAFHWPRIGAHSAKPDAFGDLVEQVSPGPYAELFCRRQRLGWDSWGHGYELPEFVPAAPASGEA